MCVCVCVWNVCVVSVCMGGGVVDPDDVSVYNYTHIYTIHIYTLYTYRVTMWYTVTSACVE